MTRNCAGVKRNTHARKGSIVIEEIASRGYKKLEKLAIQCLSNRGENLLGFLVNYGKMHQHQDDEMKVGGELKKKPADRACSGEGERVRR